MKDFYVISASEVGGVPLFLDLEWLPALPDFNQVVKDPMRSVFQDSYVAKVGLDDLSVDVIFEQYLASTDFVSHCESCSCSFIAVPLSVELRNGLSAAKGYSFFYVLSRYSLLDLSCSKFMLMDEGLLRSSDDREGMSPVYERIDKFVPRSDVDCDLFYCEELKQMVCSEEFRVDYLGKGLTGLDFEKIDYDYTYLPWGDF